MSKKPHDVKDLKLADQRQEAHRLGGADMPVLRKVRERFAKEKPLKGVTLAACLHVTTETANLMRALKAGGAKVALCASNPLSTQDDIAAALVKHEDIPTFAIQRRGHKTYYSTCAPCSTNRRRSPWTTAPTSCRMLHTRLRRARAARCARAWRRPPPASSACAPWSATRR